MAEVFVSYAHRDVDRVGPLAGAIGESGRSLWWDDALLPCDDYAMVIERELGAAGCCVVAWSAAARESLWVRAEANEALDAGKLVQLTLDGAKLPLPFTILHSLDFTRWGGERDGSPWSDLDRRIDGTLRGEAAGDAPPDMREPRLQGLGPVVAMGWAALALALLIAGAAGAAAAGALGAAPFGTLAALGLAAAALLLALTGWTALRIFKASRR